MPMAKASALRETPVDANASRNATRQGQAIIFTTVALACGALRSFMRKTA